MACNRFPFVLFCFCFWFIFLCGLRICGMHDRIAYIKICVRAHKCESTAVFLAQLTLPLRVVFTSIHLLWACVSSFSVSKVLENFIYSFWIKLCTHICWCVAILMSVCVCFSSSMLFFSSHAWDAVVTAFDWVIIYSALLVLFYYDSFFLLLFAFVNVAVATVLATFSTSWKEHRNKVMCDAFGCWYLCVVIFNIVRLFMRIKWRKIKPKRCCNFFVF